MLKPTSLTYPPQTRHPRNSKPRSHSAILPFFPNMPGLWSVHDNPSSRLCRIPLPSLPHLGPNARDFGLYTSGALVPNSPPSTPIPHDTSTDMCVCCVVCAWLVGFS